MQVTDAMVAKARDAIIDCKCTWRPSNEQVRAILTAALAEMWRPIDDVAEERERCAKIVDAAHHSENLADRSPKHIATAIRAGKEG